MKIIFKYLCVPVFITLPVSSVYADEVVELPNTRLINSNYDYTGKKLIIKWTKDESPNDGSPIRDSKVIAQNIIIETDFPDSHDGTLNKGIWSDNHTDVTASEINITAYDDGVYTSDYNGTTNIYGFKNLNITSTATGFGLVDNGKGIYIKGDDGSNVTIKSKGKPAIGNTLKTSVFEYGKGISIIANNITLESEEHHPEKYGLQYEEWAGTIFAGNGYKEKFNINLDAQENINIKGMVAGNNGDIAMKTHNNGRISIYALDNPNKSILLRKGSNLTINEDSAGLVQITGKIDVSGEGSCLLANMTGTGSYITTKDSDTSKVAIEASEGGTVNLNMSGANSSITGDLKTGTGQKASITANLSGEGSRFTGNAEVIGDYSYDRWSKYTFSEGNEINLTLSGDNTKQEGNLKAEGDNTLNATYSGRGSALGTLDNRSTVDNKGIMNLSFTNQSVLNGDILNGVKVYEDDNSQPLKTFEGKLTANFEQSSHWNGNLSNRGGRADVTLGNGGR